MQVIPISCCFNKLYLMKLHIFISTISSKKQNNLRILSLIIRCSCLELFCFIWHDVHGNSKVKQKAQRNSVGKKDRFVLLILCSKGCKVSTVMRYMYVNLSKSYMQLILICPTNCLTLYGMQMTLQKITRGSFSRMSLARNHPSSQPTVK